MARLLATLCVVGLLAAGCGQQPAGPGPQSTPSLAGPRPDSSQSRVSNTDPCAMRLHDLCEPLLLYYLHNQSLPSRLEELRDVPGVAADKVQLTCPVSNQPYVYNPVGVVNPDQPERVIIYDATPAHAGFRWAISIIEPQNPQSALVTKVIALPESTFHLSLPR